MCVHNQLIHEGYCKLCFIFFSRFTPTHHACLIGSSEIVIALIELECDVNAKDKKGNNYIKILMF